MARLSVADERSALMRAAEWWERCRLIGGGNQQRGAVRLARRPSAVAFYASTNLAG